MTTNAIPAYFGPQNARLFGWLHLPNDGVANDIGIVVCNPFGYELTCAHRTIRAIAQAGASSGYAVLRFDYHGTGDSTGTDLEPDRLSSWLTSIREAIHHLKQVTGVTRIALVGIRLGTALAALAAQDRNDIAAIIAYAPIINGRKYVRELRSLSLASAAPETTSTKSDDDIQETAGFATTAATRVELAKIDLLQLTNKPAARVLILHRDDLSRDESWPRHLQSQQVEVQQAALQGYVEMMSDAHENHVPTASIESTFNWLTNGGAADLKKITLPETASATVEAVFTVMDGGKSVQIRESLVFTDAQRTQFGIVSEPIDGAKSGNQLLILLSSGAVARPGPNRLYVALARTCASLGIAVLRVDISGIGDSAPRKGEQDNVVYTQYAQQDIAQAIEFINSRFASPAIHLGGICSGGFHSLNAAVAGMPIRSILVINPLTFFWEPGMTLAFPTFQATAEAMRYRRSVLKLTSWFKVLRGDADISAAIKVAQRRTSEIVISAVRNVCRLCNIRLAKDLGSELQTVAAHNIDMQFIFSATDPGLAMLREQSGVALSRLIKRGKLHTSVIDGADHTFTSKQPRDQLISLVTTHLAGYGNKNAAR